jgi:long-subunit fatty acid transport protein
MMTNNTRLCVISFLLFCLMMSAPAGLWAQMWEDSEPGQDSRLSVKASSLYEPPSHVSGAGDVSVSRYSIAANSTWPVIDKVSVGMGFSYEFDDYDFSRLSGFAVPDPWSKIDRVGVHARVMYSLSPEWRLFAGPAGQYAGEQGAKVDDSLLYGGTVGAIYKPSPTLMIGFGAGIFYRLGTTSFFPAFIFSWKITDNLRLGNSYETGPAGPAGLELAYAIDHKWETAISGGYSSYRFRLDNNGPTPNGIGQADSWPFVARLSRKLGPNLRLDLYGGAAFGGKLRLDDSQGHEIDRTSYNTAPLVGLALKTLF